MTATSSVSEEWAKRQAARGVTLKVRNGRLWLQPGTAYKEMSDDDRAFLRHHRAELKAIALRGPAEVAKPDRTPEEPTPDLYVFGRRVTEKDVVTALKALDDQALVDYHAGRLSKTDAYERARCRLQQEQQLAAGRKHHLGERHEP